jgi:heat shock protein HslJ
MMTMMTTTTTTVLVVALVSGCALGQPPKTLDPNAPSQSNLPAGVVDLTWQWVSLTTPVEQVNVDSPERYTIRLERTGRAAVRADCNRGATSYAVSATRQIVLKPIALTRMMCPPGSLSDRFVQELSRGFSYFLKDGDLFLDLPVDSGTLRFRRQT